MAEVWPPTLERFTIEHHRCVVSTQDLAHARAAAGHDRLVVVADVQTGGRGRRQRGWMSPEGNLYTSILLRRRFPPALAPAFSLVVAVALAETLAVPEATVKWPNDVLLGGRKVAGLLLEATNGHVVIGFGANVESAPFEEATSLRDQGVVLDRQTLLAGVLRRLDAGAADLEQHRFAIWRERWLARAAWLGERVRAHRGERVVTGVHRGIDADGALILELEDGSHVTIVAGDVERLRLEDTR